LLDRSDILENLNRGPVLLLPTFPSDGSTGMSILRENALNKPRPHPFMPLSLSTNDIWEDFMPGHYEVYGRAQRKQISRYTGVELVVSWTEISTRLTTPAREDDLAVFRKITTLKIG
jgi:hypothetical protein